MFSDMPIKFCYNLGMITFEDVVKVYPPKIKVLDGVSFHIKPGEFVSIVGASGSGKTTLGKLLLAEEKPTSGKIKLGDWEINKISRGEVPDLRRQVGVVFQDFKLLPNRTAYENVAFALEVSGTTRRQILEIAPQVLKIVNLTGVANRYPHQLSGGEQQRVSIARALAHRPKILLADEPTGNLDAINAGEIIELLKKINEFGTTVLLVTHDREIVNRLRRRVITLKDGKVSNDVLHGQYHL